MDLPKVHSITKKLCVALLGGFLLLFLLFHATANLFILRHDDGAWYSAFCHFMGSNWIVKAFEVVLIGSLVLHIILTLWIAIANRRARPVRYHKPQRSATHPYSKLMMWTGIALLFCFFMHFYDFYFVKLGWFKGEYMVKVERIQDETVLGLAEYAQISELSVDEFIDDTEVTAQKYADETTDLAETQAYIALMREKAPVANIVYRARQQGNVSADGEWYRHLTYDERQTLKQLLPESKPEPDFYYMAREKFSHLHIVIGYLFFFVVIFMHMRHAFPSAFQTLGLNNYRYNNVIEVIGKVYAWVVCLMFAIVPVLVYLGM